MVFPTAPPPSTPVGEPSGVAVGLRAVQRTFPDGTQAIASLDLDLSAGSFVALLGPSGCGKSTLLRLIAGLDKPQSGSVSVTMNEHPVDRSPIAYVFQEAQLLPWRKVIDNVALPLQLAGLPRDLRRERAQEALERVGLGDATDKRPAELSGGMRMRVSLARALVTRPRLLLLDEPFGALDELTRFRLDDDLRTLWRELRMTVLFVTHAISEAAWLAERVVVFTPRPLRIVLDHPVDLPLDRTAETRTDPRFARTMKELRSALERGGA